MQRNNNIESKNNDEEPFITVKYKRTEKKERKDRKETQTNISYPTTNKVQKYITKEDQKAIISCIEKRDVISFLLTYKVNEVDEHQFNNKLIYLLQNCFYDYLDNYVAFEKAVESFEGLTNKFIEHCFHTIQDFKTFEEKTKKSFKDIYDSFLFELNSKDVAGTYLINKNGDKICMIETYNGKYDFPKGKLENNETPLEAAIRETMEETGYDCSGSIKEQKGYYFPFINTTEHKYGVAKKTIHMYMIKGVPDQIKFRPSASQFEVKEVKWIPIKECKSYMSYLFRKHKEPPFCFD